MKGHQFYWCDYYLYIAGVAKEMIPNRAKQNRPHRSTSRWAPRSHHTRPTGFILIYHLRPCWQELIGFSIYPSWSRPHHGAPLGGHRGWLFFRTVISIRMTLPFFSLIHPWNCTSCLLAQLTIHRTSVVMTTLLLIYTCVCSWYSLLNLGLTLRAILNGMILGFLTRKRDALRECRPGWAVKYFHLQGLML